jgi:hypothetical protein
LEKQDYSMNPPLAWPLARFDARIQISAEVGFEGPVFLQATIRGAVSEADEVQRVQIANVVSPITVEAVASDVQIGYAIYDVGAVTITEAAAGVLERGQRIQVSIVSVGKWDTSNITFNRITMASNVAIAGVGGGNTDMRLNLLTASGGTLSFEVATPSRANRPAEIHLSGLTVNIDRTVPFGDYTVMVGLQGSTAASRPNDWVNNVVNTATNATREENADRFVRWGVTPKNADGTDLAYIHVATEGVVGLFRNNVRIDANSTVAVVNGVELDMGAPAVITGDSFYIPLRFTATALGIADNAITWAGAGAGQGSAVIFTDARIVVFTMGSTSMQINGANVPMAAGVAPYLAVEPGAEFGVTMLPFRALGNAFGIDVTWGYENGEIYAIFNPTAAERTAAEASQAAGR